MSTIPPGVLSVTDADLGHRLDFNVLDNENRLLFKAGEVIDQHMVAQVAGRAIHAWTNVQDVRSEHVKAELFQSFPEEKIHRLIEVVDLMAQTLASTSDSLRFKSNMRVSEVVNSVSQVVHETTRDLQAMIVALTLRTTRRDPDLVERLLNHSTQLSSLAAAIAVMAGLEKRTVTEVAVAGLLHDLSLILRSENFDPSQCKVNHALRAEFRRHPLVSAEMLKSMPGLSAESLLLVAQVHEQCDGSGYPEGLNSESILPGAKVLNIADAYLSLVSPLKGPSMVSSDALAYLCHHATRGKFDRTILRLFVKHMSMYPLGSVVELDDRSAAVVVGSNPLAPLSPIVSIHGKEVNLHTTNRTIEKVATNGLLNSIRISKRRLNEVLWRLDA
ncbi:MAG: HD domain-containing protein [Pirellula sp.]|jgi:HD-GYP domain-containing protein (c-di-GMP phosphodiesterase class II)|nr:HD domain-containing protein [Pirellula sp.]